MSQARLLYILTILEKETDAEHGITLNEVCRIISARYPDGVCSDQRVRQDISLLQALSEENVLPFRIDAERESHNQYCYRLYRPAFKLNEARMVFDSVSISQFLTERQKKDLLSQMEGFLSINEVRQLKQRVSSRPCLMPGKTLPDNLKLIYSAIDQKKCILFDYTRFNLQGKAEVVKRYCAIRPVQVVWEQEHYYLVALNPAHAEGDQQRTYRIDRMQNIQHTNDRWLKVKLIKPSHGQFDMFSAKEKTRADFRVKSELLDMIFETFGTDIFCRQDTVDRSWVRFSAEVEDSEGFIRWVLHQAGKLEVLSPKALRDKIETRIQNMLKGYR